jgi:hypothetical protein
MAENDPIPFEDGPSLDEFSSAVTGEKVRIVAMGIPASALVVKTVNSVYRLGPAPGSGDRTITRDQRPLLFKLCRVTTLKVGQAMELLRLDVNTHVPWRTTIVRSITPG